MPTALLVLLIVLAVAGGFYVGHLAGRQPAALEGKKPPKSLGQRAREAATQGAVGLWKWNRARKKKAREEERERS